MKKEVEEMQDDVKLEVQKASEIKPKEIEWLWYPYIPFGKITLLQGDPGDGKSKLMITLSAMLTRGSPLPFTDETEDKLKPMAVIYQTTEDDADDTVVPRFLDSGGDPEKLIFIKEDVKSLTFGDNRIKEAITKFNAKLLILDPLSSYIGPNCCINSSNETRAQFNYLIETARSTGCAIVIITHLNKNRDTSPLYRTAGSIDIVGAVRSILGICRRKGNGNPNSRIMVQVKSNLAPTGSAILFEVTEKGVVFTDEVEMTVEEAAGYWLPDMGRPHETRDECISFIKEMLKDGRLPAKECLSRLAAAGYKKTTIKKAKKAAGVVSEKTHEWMWLLPETNDTGENGGDPDDGDLPFDLVS